MENVQVVLLSTFFAGAAICFAVLCVVLWLAAIAAETIGIHSEKRREFYRMIFWIIYMFLAMVCGMFVLATQMEFSLKVKILMVLLVADIIAAGKMGYVFEKAAVEAVERIRSFRRRFK